MNKVSLNIFRMLISFHAAYNFKFKILRQWFINYVYVDTQLLYAMAWRSKLMWNMRPKEEFPHG